MELGARGDDGMKTWIVIAAYHEGRVIRDVARAVCALYPNVVVVDDASADNTGDEARAAGATVLRHLINRGQGAALKTGIVYALSQGAEAIVTFDADGQHDPKEIAAMLAPIERGEADITLGSRFLQGGSNVPPLRRIVLRLGIMFTRIFSHIKVTDTHNGFRAMNRAAAEKIRIIQDRMAHASEILDEIIHHKLRYKEVPVTITYSYYSKEKGQNSLAMFKIAIKFLMYKLRN
jgi:glycosyltransferase involved in cell wall biosynthesis